MTGPVRASWFAPCLGAFALAGCVLPVSPEFEEPEPNVPPFIWSANPPEGSIVTAVGDTAPEIAVTLADPNLSDRLYVRWVFDYPPLSPDTRNYEVAPLPASRGGSQVRGTVRLTPNCLQQNIAGGFNNHRLYLIVADRAFLPLAQAKSYEAVPTGGFVIHASWMVNIECRR